ncbi:cytidine deaminase family protein [Saccharothrix syringae]|uniref:Cytidine deaminase n=1 Tax=Saccharothrix syringae TaxID=103733 RepID=A0A5Q0GU93_SACSY|nr:cytidine deaminase [Saccharothrix syringae]QFZ17070.1 cytidine deaminase [Saccharothrix syringae]
MLPTDAERELLATALRTARARTRWRHHNAAAAGRAPDGRVFTGLNVFHFAGGPCAELVVLGAAAAEGVYELESVVAVDATGVIVPCGRCRQVLSDLVPGVRVLVAEDEVVGVGDLLPRAYRWAEHLAALEQRRRDPRG